jgi:hypothetical protein
LTILLFGFDVLYMLNLGLPILMIVFNVLNVLNH